ncbi:MAG: GNAT family N-acetyltransferase [Candidatus Rokuibacteriota bacterium]
MNRVSIRDMRVEDVETAARFMAIWGDKRPDLRFYLSHAQCRPLVAEVAGVVVGTGNTTFNGATGWMGDLFVTAEARRAGVGSALFETRMKYLETRGCQSIALLATAMGRPLYERFGFRSVSTMYHLRGRVGASKEPESRVRRPVAADIPAIAALDRQASGEDRHHLIEAFASRGWLATDHDGVTEAYYLPTPWGQGALVGKRSAAAELLLALYVRERTPGDAVQISVPGDNAAAMRYLGDRGFEVEAELTRMTKGSSIDWDPTMLWGAFGLGLG